MTLQFGDLMITAPPVPLAIIATVATLGVIGAGVWMLPRILNGVSWTFLAALGVWRTVRWVFSRKSEPGRFVATANPLRHPLLTGGSLPPALPRADGAAGEHPNAQTAELAVPRLLDGRRPVEERKCEMDSGPWLTTEEAAAHLRVAPRTLENWRHQDRGPRYAKRGGVVRYSRAALDAWLTEAAPGGAVR